LLEEKPVLIYDLARRLEVERKVPRVEQKLVILKVEGKHIAFSADRIRDPQSITRESYRSSDELAAGDPSLKAMIKGVARDEDGGSLPVLDLAAMAAKMPLEKTAVLLKKQLKAAGAAL
jgi:chemotaxis signal transduction protein